MDIQILLKFGKFVLYVSPEAMQWLKSIYFDIQDGGRPPNFRYLNCYNSAKYSSIFAAISYFGAMWVRGGRTVIENPLP